MTNHTRFDIIVMVNTYSC